MEWYSKISGAMDIARGGGRRFLLTHLDPDVCLAQSVYAL
jgi:hypothetical protein